MFGRRRIVASIAVLALLGVGVSQALDRSRGTVRTGSPAARGAEILRYAVRSRFVHRTLPQVAAIPRGAGAGERRPLLVFLHGRGSDGQESNANGAFFHALDRLGARAPAVVFPSGGESSYFHRRAGGDWGRYVLDEVIPQALRRLHADPRRVAIGGISMGGFGALDLGSRGTFCAVGAHSAALWFHGGDTAPGAFDDAADFARHDLVAGARTKPGRWVGPRLWLDAGRTDPFQPGDRAFVAALKAHRVPISAHLGWHGGHDHSYWQRHWPAYLDFYASALAHCR
jgi:S-formylglutathione hydrolase FrmB